MTSNGSQFRSKWSFTALSILVPRATRWGAFFFRWKHPNGNLKYQTFIPDTVGDSGAPTDKGAVYHEYDPIVDEFVTYLRRVHLANPRVNMDVKGTLVKVQVCNPLAPAGHPLYYYRCWDGWTSAWLYLQLGLPVDECNEFSVWSFRGESHVYCVLLSLVAQEVWLLHRAGPTVRNCSSCRYKCFIFWTSAFRCFHLLLERMLWLRSIIQRRAWCHACLVEWIACWARATCCTRRNQAALKKMNRIHFRGWSCRCPSADGCFGRSCCTPVDGTSGHPSGLPTWPMRINFIHKHN